MTDMPGILGHALSAGLEHSPRLLGPPPAHRAPPAPSPARQVCACGSACAGQGAVPCAKGSSKVLLQTGGAKCCRSPNQGPPDLSMGHVSAAGQSYALRCLPQSAGRGSSYLD